MIRKLNVLLRRICLIAAVSTGIANAQSVLTHHVRDVVQSGAAQPTGLLPPNQIMNLDVVLPFRDAEGLQRFLSDLYNPASPNHRHFLSVQEFTDRFGPTEEDYDALVRFAQNYGLTVTGGTRDGMSVQVRGPVMAIESAFHLSLRTYQHPTENRIFYSPDREPSHTLTFNLWHVTGLDNYSIPRPRLSNRNDYAKAHNISPEAVVSHATTGSGPSASFLGTDMRAAYYGNGSLTGAGQNLGLLEYVGTDLADLTTYFNNAHQTNQVPITLLSTDGTSTSCVSPGCDDTEQTLDMTQALGMAPGLASLVVYVGSSDTAIISAMTTHNPLPTTIGCSWGWTPADPATLDPYFQRMAAQGQTFFAASGDNSTWTSSNFAWPADDAYVVSVGGTDLVTAGAAGPWQSETAWVDSGGGISPDRIAIPTWQQLPGVINSSNRGSTTFRNGPDVSANANFTFYVCADQSCTANNYGGTSFAAPMWAGYIALVNQQLATSGQTPVGSLNPTIYAQNVTSSYNTDFHDITSGTSGSYSAVTGYDLVTGWGSPNAGLIAALSGPPTPGFSLSASPASQTVVQGNGTSYTATVTASGGFTGTVSLSVSGLPSGATATFNPTSIANGSGSSTMNVTTLATTTTGTFTLTITGTSGSLTHTTMVTLVVNPAVAPNFSISASPSSRTVTQGSGTTYTATATPSGGFSGSVSLSASGLPTGATATFNPTSIANGSGSSTMNVTTLAGTTTGTFTLTITGSSGSLSHTTTVALVVNPANTGNFSISASPPSQTVTRGNPTSYTATVTPSGGFTGSVTLSASGLPSGVNATFSPGSITNGTSTMSVTTSTSTTPGTYTLTIAGTSGSLTHSTTVTLIVNSTGSPDFSITVSPSTRTVTRGNSTTYTVTVAAINGFTGTVTFRARGLPSNSSASFSPSSVTGGGTSTMTVTTSSSTSTGTFSLRVRGSSGGATHSVNVTLIVQ